MVTADDDDDDDADDDEDDDDDDDGDDDADDDEDDDDDADVDDDDDEDDDDDNDGDDDDDDDDYYDDDDDDADDDDDEDDDDDDDDGDDDADDDEDDDDDDDHDDDDDGGGQSHSNIWIPQALHFRDNPFMLVNLCIPWLLLTPKFSSKSLAIQSKISLARHSRSCVTASQYPWVTWASGKGHGRMVVTFHVNIYIILHLWKENPSWPMCTGSMYLDQ